MKVLVWLKEWGRRLGLLPASPVLYIGGSDTLPPPLTREEEAELLTRLQEDEVRKTLIERNLRLVVYIARRFENTGINIEDLISIGTIGLINRRLCSGKGRHHPRRICLCPKSSAPRL